MAFAWQTGHLDFTKGFEIGPGVPGCIVGSGAPCSWIFTWDGYWDLTKVFDVRLTAPWAPRLRAWHVRGRRARFFSFPFLAFLLLIALIQSPPMS